MKIFSFVCVLGLLGCSGSKDMLPTAPVEGVVTYQGKPLTVGKVVFFHHTGQAASGDLSDTGGFKMDAFQGKNTIAIVSFGPDRPNPIKNALPAIVPGESLVPRHYNEAQTSGLTFEVKDSINVVDLSLED